MSPQSSGQAAQSSSSSTRPTSSVFDTDLKIETRRNREPGQFTGQLDHHSLETTSQTSYNGVNSSVDAKSRQEEEIGLERHNRVGHSEFLLDPKATSSQVARRSPKSLSAHSEKANGKRRAENGELQIPKRGGGRSLPQALGSSGSPLAREILKNQEAQSNGSPGARHNEKSSNVSSEHNSYRSTGSGSQSLTGTGRSRDFEDRPLWRNSVGRETDPAQIVNLALNLGESRRRHASGTLLLGQRDVSGGKRITSAGQKSIGSPYGAGGGSLRRHAQEQKRTLSGVSPQSGNSFRGQDPASSLQIQRATGDRPDDKGAFEDEIFSPSDATLARAEKARAALELGFEYRRLLQYLPALPTSGRKKRGISRHHDSQSTKDRQVLGREYNPLQYIRNRKLRLREKKPLPELDGWRDVAKVRAWIETVKADREVGISRVDDRFPLPPFDAVEAFPSVIDNSGSPHAPQPRRTSGNQLRRPETDWIFSPFDLLADVHWLDQHHNMTRIEDSTGRKLIIDHESKTHASPRASKEYAQLAKNRSSVSLTGYRTSLDFDASTNARSEHQDSMRKRPPKTHESKQSGSTDDGSRTHRSRWSKKLLRSRSSSISNDSDLSRTSRHYLASDRSENAILEKQMMEILAAESRENEPIIPDAVKLNGYAQIPGGKTSLEVPRDPPKPSQRPQTLHRMKTEDPTINRRPPSPRASLEKDYIRHRRMSSDDLMTAPTSPVTPGLAANITVDESPPKSPPSATLSPIKRPFAARLGSFRRDRSKSVDKRAASDDASKDSGTSAPVTRETTNEFLSPGAFGQRSTHAFGGLLLPNKSDLSMARYRASDGRSTRHGREHSSPESRFRGMLRSGRIAELVGTEVSKVGDKLFKKGSSTNLAQMVSPTSTYLTDESADESEYSDTMSRLDSPNDSLSPTTTKADVPGKKPPRSLPNDKPKYFMNNLPNFRSSFADQGRQSSANQSPTDDHHITRQQRALRESSRSNKFERLAPPRIDMRSISRSPSRGRSRSESREPDGRSRASSNSRSMQGVHNANGKLNDMLSLPGRVGRGDTRPPVMGLAAFSNTADGSQQLEKEMKPWSISDHGITAIPGTISKRDIARVRALLLSSGIKAHEVIRRYEEPPESPSDLLKSVEDVIKGPLPQIPPSQELVFAARAIIMDIEGINKELRDAADRFTSETMEGLHEQMKTVDEHVNMKLTPLVRAAADDADAFSTELTTTHTLAMKQLNDSIDGILRKRRRRMRWLRRGGWATLEWMLLGVMWMAWACAVAIRIFRGTVRAFVNGVRWLLWL